MPRVKCCKCGKEMKREDVAYLYIGPEGEVGACNNCFVEADANEMELSLEDVNI